MNDVFRPMLRKFALVFFNDILIYSCQWGDRLRHVSTVLRVLQRHQLVVNMKKCQFGKSIIEYLGHLILSGGVAID